MVINGWMRQGNTNVSKDVESFLAQLHLIMPAKMIGLLRGPSASRKARSVRFFSVPLKRVTRKEEVQNYFATCIFKVLVMPWLCTFTK